MRKTFCHLDAGARLLFGAFIHRRTLQRDMSEPKCLVSFCSSPFFVFEPFSPKMKIHTGTVLVNEVVMSTGDN
jgi:hypothetical protein